MNRNEQTEQMLIQFYNMCAGMRFRFGEENRVAVARALDACGTVYGVKEKIKGWINENPEDSKKQTGLIACMNEIAGVVDVPPVVEPTCAPTTDPAAVTGALNVLERAVVKIIADTQTEKIEAAIMSSVEDKVRAFIAEEYGPIERKITTIINGVERPMQGVSHEKFETVVKFVANDEPVFLTGPAGCGKNILCKQVAEALGLNFYFSNAVTQEYKLTGFTDAMGHYQETQFYKAFTEGGLFMLDEMDASIPEVLVILNAAIANKYFDFPAPIGYREAHPNFRVIAAGNTTGNGADLEYVGRNQLDAASLDRFAVVQMDYSEAIENSLAGGNEVLARFCRRFRKAANDAGVKIIVSYRAIGRLAKMVKLLDEQEAIETCLLKGLEADDIRMIYNAMSDNSNYYLALGRCAA